MIITFLRHTETKMNTLGQLQGSIDAELSDDGKKHVEQIVSNVDFSTVDVIVSSALSRAKYLAKRIQQVTGKELIIDPRFNEIMLGEWQGLTWKEVTKKYQDFLSTW